MKSLIQSKVALLLVGVGLTVASCAVAPIKITEPMGMPIAQKKVNGFEVRVSIEDARKTQDLGSRGGVYSETSMISSGEELVDKIGANFIQAMKNQGYQLVAKAPANLQVKLESLTYEVNEVNTTTKDSLVAVDMSFYVEHEKGYIQKNFKVNISQTTVLLPTQKSIEKMVSDALVNVMQKGLDDNELQNFIASSQSLDLMPESNVSQSSPSEAPEPDLEEEADPSVSTEKPVVAPVESKTYKILL